MSRLLKSQNWNCACHFLVEQIIQALLAKEFFFLQWFTCLLVLPCKLEACEEKVFATHQSGL